MTLDKKLSKQIYKTNGSAVDFPFSFEVFEKDYIAVTISNDTEPLTTQVHELLPHEVSLSEKGGSVKIYFDRNTQSPYPAGYTIAITRNMPFLQLVSLLEGGAFHAKVIENSFDIMKAELQQLYEIIERAVIVPVTSEQSPQHLLAEFFEAQNHVLALEESARINSQKAETAAQNAHADSQNAQYWAVADIATNPEGSARYWAENVSSGLAEATTLQKGIVQRATDEIASQGNDEEFYINAKQLISEITRATPNASNSKVGLIRKATNTEVVEGVSEEGAINPKQYKDNLPISFPLGTRMLFQQASAPSGWIKEEDSSYNDIALKVSTANDVTVQGSLAFSSVFNSKNLSVSGSTGNTTLSLAQLASHNHIISNVSSAGSGDGAVKNFTHSAATMTQTSTTFAGSNQGHAHSFSGNASLNMQVKHCSVIICTKA